MWPWLPCVLHQAVALSEEHLPSLQDCCHQDLKYQLQARSVERGGIEKNLFCTAHYICYCYINTTSIRCILQIEMPYFGYLSSNLWVLNSETLLLEGNFEEVLQRRMNHVI